MSDRLSLLLSRHGPKAAAFWGLRQSLGLDFYRLLTIDLGAVDHLIGPSSDGVKLLKLASTAEVARCDADIVAELDANNGCTVANTVSAGGSVYALVHEGRVVSQLRIDVRTTWVDTPCHMTIRMADRQAFLSFLHTPANSRRKGFASQLVRATQLSLASLGLAHCHCHVQATNVRSRATFASLGWYQSGWIVATTNGRLVRAWTGRQSLLEFVRDPG